MSLIEIVKRGFNPQNDGHLETGGYFAIFRDILHSARLDTVVKI